MKEARYYQDNRGPASYCLVNEEGSNYYSKEIPGHYIELATGSDYSGGTVTRSNYETIKEMLADRPGVYDCLGGYGTYSIFVADAEIDGDTRAIVEDIEDRLAGYCILDEDALCQREHDLIEAAADDEMAGILSCIYEDYENRRDLESLKEAYWQAIRDGEGDYVLIETGEVVYIDTEKVITRVKAILAGEE